MSSRNPEVCPPRVAEAILRRVLPEADREPILGDLTEEFICRVREGRAASARWWYWRHVGRSILPALERRARRPARNRRFPIVPKVPGLGTDLRQTFRALLRTPWLSTATLVIAAFAIAATLAVFSFVDRMLFRPLPFAQPDRLVLVHRQAVTAAARPYLTLDGALFVEFRQRARSIVDLAFVQEIVSVSASEDGEARPLTVARVTHNLLRTLGIRPIQGRDISIDDVNGRRSVVLVTHQSWQARFGGSASILGQRVGPATQPFEVIGILPPDFLLPTSQLVERIDALAPAALTLDEPLERMSHTTKAPVARLAPGVTRAQAEAELRMLQDALVVSRPDRFPARWKEGHVEVHPLRDGVTLLYRPYLLFIVGGAAAILLLTWINLSTMLIARGQQREREMGLRRALGASRLRLIGLSVIEAVTMMGLATAIGALALGAAAPLISAAVPPEFHGFAVPFSHPRVLMVAMLASLAGALVMALLPAWQACGRDLAATVRKPHRSREARSGLVVMQTALSVVLMSAAAVSARSFMNLAYTDPGFVADDVYQVSTEIGAGHRRAAADPRAPAVLRALRSVPGLVVAGAATGLPLVGGAGGTAFWRDRQQEGWEAGVTEGALEALGLQLRAGRLIHADDVSNQMPVAVISEGAARALWPSEDPRMAIGRTFPYINGVPLTVVGVIADVRRFPGETPTPLLFVPFGTPGLTSASDHIFAAIRVAPGGPLEAALVRDRIREQLGPGPVNIRSVASLAGPYLRRPRFQAVLFGTIATLATLLSSLGLFALTAFEVARRRYEIGVRLSVGATRRHIHRHVLAGALRPVLLGVLVGVMCSAWAATWVQSLLSTVDARDPWTLALVVTLLVIAASAAAWFPARQAARVDPVITLRAE